MKDVIIYNIEPKGWLVFIYTVDIPWHDVGAILDIVGNIDKGGMKPIPPTCEQQNAESPDGNMDMAG